jgi:precorrin-6x reductase
MLFGAPETVGGPFAQDDNSAIYQQLRIDLYVDRT